MDVIHLMKQSKGKLTPRELEIYEIVMSNPLSVVTSTTAQIAAKYNISQSAFSRFCQKIGFGNFNEFRMALAMTMGTNNTGQPKAKKEAQEISDTSYDLKHMITVTREYITDAILDSLCQKIMQASIVYTTGSALSSLPAQLLEFQLILTGISSHYIPSGREVEILNVTRDTDLVILFSAVNPTHQNFCAGLRTVASEKKPHTLLVTSSRKHPLSGMVDEVIQLPNWMDLDYPKIVDFSFPPMVFCYLLSKRLFKLYGEESALDRIWGTY